MPNLYTLQVSKRYVAKEVSQEIHSKAAPFVKWLQEADTEESSESEEESDADVEIEYDDRAQVTPLKPQSVKSERAVEEDEGEDLNIDEI